MRVISGSARGVPLKSIESPDLRPMLDRVKESLFNILRNYVEDASVLDLFAGSGSLGIEALSRGARGCVFVERDRKLAALIEENLQKCRLSESTEIVRCDVLRLPSREPPGWIEPATLTFADPPYAMMEEESGRERLFGVLGEMLGTWMEWGGILMLHHPPPGPDEWPSDQFVAVDNRTYGRSVLTFFRSVRRDDADGEGD